MDIKFFASAVVLSFVTVLIDMTLGINYVFILIVLSVLSFAVSYYYNKFKEASIKSTNLLNQTKSQFVENSEELAEAYKQLIAKDSSITNASDVISTKIANSVSIVNSYLNLINEEELSQDEINLFVNKILDETERISVDTRDLVKDLTGNDSEILYEQAELGELIKSVIKCSKKKISISNGESIVIPCDRKDLENCLCEFVKIIDKDMIIEYFTTKTPRSIVSSEFAKITFTLSYIMELSEKEKEIIFSLKPPRNAKKLLKALNALRKIVEKHNGSFWFLVNNESTVINLTIPTKPNFIS